MGYEIVKPKDNTDNSRKTVKSAVYHCLASGVWTLASDSASGYEHFGAIAGSLEADHADAKKADRTADGIERLGTGREW
jgi:hypothetical protein